MGSWWSRRWEDVFRSVWDVMPSLSTRWHLSALRRLMASVWASKQCLFQTSCMPLRSPVAAAGLQSRRMELSNAHLRGRRTRWCESHVLWQASFLPCLFCHTKWQRTTNGLPMLLLFAKPDPDVSWLQHPAPSKTYCDATIFAPKFSYHEGGEMIYNVMPETCCGGCCVACDCRSGKGLVYIRMQSLEASTMTPTPHRSARSGLGSKKSVAPLTHLRWSFRKVPALQGQPSGSYLFDGLCVLRRSWRSPEQQPLGHMPYWAIRGHLATRLADGFSWRLSQ